MPPPAAGEVSGAGQGMDGMPVSIEECIVIVLRMTLIQTAARDYALWPPLGGWRRSTITIWIVIAPFFFLFLLAGLVLNTTSNRELSHQVGSHAIEMPRAAITCR
jgi:hypothetical protein